MNEPPTTRTGAHLEPARNRADPAAVPRGLVLASEWSWRLLLVAAGLVAVFYVLRSLSELAIAISIALLLAGLLHPVADVLRRLRVPRGIASLLTLLLLIAFLGGLGTLVGARIAGDFGSLSASVGRSVGQLQGVLGRFGITSADISAGYARVRSTLSAGGAGGVASGALSVGSLVGRLATGLVITLFTLFFFLTDGRSLWAYVTRMFPGRATDVVDGAGRRAFAAVTGYVRATVIVALADAVGVFIVATILRVPLAFPLAALVFVGAFVPIVGTLTSGSVAVLVALLQSPLIALLMLLGVLLVVEVEGHVLQPLVLGRAVGLHPLVVFFAITAGGLLAGIVGVLLAVPVTAAVVAVVRTPQAPRRSSGPRRFRLFSRRKQEQDPADTEAAEIGAGAAGAAGALG